MLIREMHFWRWFLEYLTIFYTRILPLGPQTSYVLIHKENINEQGLTPESPPPVQLYVPSISISFTFSDKSNSRIAEHVCVYS